MLALLRFFGRPAFWLVVAWLLLPVNIVSVILYTSVPAILALCVNVAVVASPLWWRLHR
jgi:hypothetical protein